MTRNCISRFEHGPSWITEVATSTRVKTGERMWTNEAERTGNVEISTAEFLAAGEACKDIFLPTLGLAEITGFDQCRCSAESILISASAVTHWVVIYLY